MSPPELLDPTGPYRALARKGLVRCDPWSRCGVSRGQEAAAKATWVDDRRLYSLN